MIYPSQRMKAFSSGLKLIGAPRGVHLLHSDGFSLLQPVTVLQCVKEASAYQKNRSNSLKKRDHIQQWRVTSAEATSSRHAGWWEYEDQHEQADRDPENRMLILVHRFTAA